ncbi:SigE family RNA polymerase sigma factor [Kitasatospora sp. NPDC096147]|uniref:SigE family RNA polymerase sigma factor n=1 Tax=Kitasatospora sp. NPDC096147 TaxID=3364093 RepID=UPI0037FC1EF5
MADQRAQRDTEFQAFITASWSRLTRTAFLLAGETHAAEDLAQSTLERAYVAWGRVRSADDRHAYVRRILLNEHARRFRRRPREHLVTAVPESAGPDHYGRLDERAALLAALATLPPRQRQAVVLRYWEDLSETRTAEAMGCSVGTVKSQTAKGIARLRASSVLLDLTTTVGGGK